LQGQPPLELLAFGDFVASVVALFRFNGTVEDVVESVMFLVSFMSLLRFMFMDKFLISTLLVGMVKLAFVVFKCLVALPLQLLLFLQELHQTK
jgi:hypothetical protein